MWLELGSDREKWEGKSGKKRGGADLEGHAATGRTPVLTLREMESL